MIYFLHLTSAQNKNCKLWVRPESIAALQEYDYPDLHCKGTLVFLKDRGGELEVTESVDEISTHITKWKNSHAIT